MDDLNNTEQIPVLNDNNQGNKQNKKKKGKRTVSPAWNIVLTVLAIFINVAFIAEMFYVTKYSALSKDMFIKINVAVLAVLLIIDALLFFSIRLKKIALMALSTCLIIAGTGIGGYAGYALLRVNKSVSDITNAEYTKSVNTSLVVYTKGSGKKISDVSGISGKKVGYANGTDTAEAGREYLADSGVAPEYKKYTDYTEVFNALISSEIDVAILPGAYKSVISSDEAMTSYLEDTNVVKSFTADVKAQSVVGADKDLTKEPFTVLLTGENEGLADTIMIVTVNPISMKITMTSIARDSYVPITCYNGSSSKINSAHTVSEGCMVDTVEQLTGVDIDYTVEFNFDSVIEVVDAVGGIDIYNEVSFDGLTWDTPTQAEYWIDMPEGEMHMDGVHALAYARERHAFVDGDFARQRHQQEIIQQVLAKIMATKDPNMYLDVLQAAGNNIKTNLSASQMVSFMSYCMKKAALYYDTSNVASVFNIQTNRITGYDAMKWNDGLQMYLYIYLLYDGAISDSYNAIERNTDMTETPSPLGVASWSAHDTYTPPAMSQDEYYHSGDTTIGGPDDGSESNSYVPDYGNSEITYPSDNNAGSETQPSVEPSEPVQQPETPDNGGSENTNPLPEQGGSTEEQYPEESEQSE